MHAFAFPWLRLIGAAVAPLLLAGEISAVDGTWSGLGSGPGDAVLECFHPIACSPDGNVFVVTATASTGGKVMMWNGSQWRAVMDLGSSSSGPLIQGLAASPSGSDVVVYGLAAFPVAGGSCNAIARFDGSQFQTMAGGISTLANYSGINCASYSHDGTLYVGGDFSQVGSVSANGIAAWSGGAWSTVGGSNLGAVLLVASNKDGWIDAYGAAGYQQWNGTAWSNMQNNQDNLVDAMAMDSSGDLFIAHSTGTPSPDLYEWNTSGYAYLGQGITQAGVNGFGILGAAVAPDDTLYVTGDFAGTSQNGSAVTLTNLARWNGSSWEEVGNGLSGGIGYDISFVANASSSTGYDVVVAGTFTKVGSGSNAVAVSAVARFHPSAGTTGTGIGTGTGSSSGSASGTTTGGNVVPADTSSTAGCGLGGSSALILALAIGWRGRQRRHP